MATLRVSDGGATQVVDPKSPERTPPTPLTQAEQRGAASLRTPDFLAAAAREGALAKEDAINAGEGKWPAPFKKVLASMSDEEEVAARAHWARVQTVWYTDDMTQLVAGVGAEITGRTTEDLLDAIFGIE